MFIDRQFEFFKLALGPTQPPIQWVLGALFLGIKRPVREADHFHFVPRLRVRGGIPPLFQYVFTAWRLIHAKRTVIGIMIKA